MYSDVRRGAVNPDGSQRLVLYHTGRPIAIPREIKILVSAVRTYPLKFDESPFGTDKR